MKKIKSQKKRVDPGGVDEYIKRCPKGVQSKLQILRSAICEVAPDAIETVSYFDLPGNCYEGFDYNGMFVWFSYSSPFVRLHVRPAAIEKYKQELKNYKQTKAIVSFSLDSAIPKPLVKKLVRASLKDMTQRQARR